MQDLLSESRGQALPLIDADLHLWHDLDLGRDDRELMRDLIARCAWRQDRIRLFGKSHLQPRLSAWYGDAAYRYSGLRLEPRPWTLELAAVRARVEAATGYCFNSVLLNYYRDERDRMGLHSDDEAELGDAPAIASLSLGATRDLVMKHRTRKDLKRLRISLPSASLLLMRGATQRHWLHGIERESRPCGPRLNLTFRQIHSG